MNNLDLTKVAEECGELTQAVCKLQMFYETQDQTWEVSEEELLQALSDEIADVMAVVSTLQAKRNIKCNWLRVGEKQDLHRLYGLDK